MYEIHQQRSESNWWFKARREIVHSIVNKYIVGTNNNILEVGAGYGIMTEMLKEYGTVTAIEPYKDAAVYLQNNGINTFYCTLDSFPLKEKYDIVAMFDVLEHIDDLDAIYQVHYLLKDKGLFLVTVPAYMFLWSEHDKLNHHFLRYIKEELIAIMTTMQRSFNIKYITYFNTLLFPLALLDKLWFARNKQSYSLSPNKLINAILYRIFLFEKALLRFVNLPFGVSILLIAEKKKE